MKKSKEGLDSMQELGLFDRKMVVALARNWFYRTRNRLGIETIIFILDMVHSCKIAKWTYPEGYWIYDSEI